VSVLLANLFLLSSVHIPEVHSLVDALMKQDEDGREHDAQIQRYECERIPDDAQWRIPTREPVSEPEIALQEQILVQAEASDEHDK
jgi:hypothetical protein